MEYKRSPRIPIALAPGSGEKLERYSALVQKDKVATTAAYLLQQKLDELDERGAIPDDESLPKQDFEQIVQFLKLLTGDRTERNGISFVLLGEILGIDSGKLSDLHNLVNECREHKHSEVK
jgi:hypothetical protein